MKRRSGDPVWVYQEWCSRGGEVCVDEDLWGTDDVFLFGESEEDARRIAELWLREAEPGAAGDSMRRAARNVLQYLA